MSYTAFGKKELQYLIPNEFKLHPEITPLDSHPGCVCMGGYGEAGLASCEFFFPLRDCPDHKGTYPVFGHVVSGMDEIKRIAGVKTVPVDFPIPGVEVNKPVEPQVIETVEVELLDRLTQSRSVWRIQNCQNAGRNCKLSSSRRKHRPDA